MLLLAHNSKGCMYSMLENFLGDICIYIYKCRFDITVGNLKTRDYNFVSYCLWHQTCLEMKDFSLYSAAVSSSMRIGNLV